MSQDRDTPLRQDCCPGSSIQTKATKPLDYWDHDVDELEARLNASIVMPRVTPENATQGFIYNKEKLQENEDDNTDEKMLSDVVIPLDEVR